MKRQCIDSNIYIRLSDQTPRDILISLLEDEGDVLGWEEELLIYEAAMRIDDLPEVSIRMARYALKGLVRDGVVLREGGLIFLKD
ncbi:hypothetical protein [Polynucleobacter sp. 39-46-10]|jgi:hypothetical protein|uniref:hypothetical protein n=1 Tax=Polynucleobacter sp. 39-46-10 TaxID=1970428 RepID=UPI000BC49EDC|nr:hypothetical protein [Polynucleobacter sp. 39-46-10]OZA77724.1 MAG: hypothetical protein B7X71_03855 [Polynucleobacter sp. 39-46-10]